MALFHKDTNNAVVRIKGKNITCLVLLQAEVGYFVSFKVKGPSKRAGLISEFIQAAHYLWLFYAKITLELLRSKLVKVKTTDYVLHNAGVTFLKPVGG